MAMEKNGAITPATPDVDREMDKAAAAKAPQLRDGVGSTQQAVRQATAGAKSPAAVKAK